MYCCAKILGLFALAKYVTRKQLRILCYHGVTEGDESLFRPMVFMSASTFRARMDLLLRLRVTIMELDVAVSRLKTNELPPCPVVITFDDGFFGNYANTYGFFSKQGIPSTMYVTTYYVDYPNPVFRVAVRYMFWKAGTAIDTTCFDSVLQRRPGEERDEWMWRIIRHGETDCDEGGRETLAKQVATATGCNYEQLVQSRSLSLMRPDELRAMKAVGVDIQLHTHRHQLPLNSHDAIREVEQNQCRIESYIGHRAHHFCYPSGEWSTAHWPILESTGILSAVTCDPGLNGPETPKYALKRFLDSEDFSPIEFEAEVTGFTELLRRGRRLIKGLFIMSMLT
jgi:peptidoglycan/xylan/chitin deacetylase (PgdA/CDA1 family)